MAINWGMRAILCTKQETISAKASYIPQRRQHLTKVLFLPAYMISCNISSFIISIIFNTHLSKIGVNILNALLLILSHDFMFGLGTEIFEQIGNGGKAYFHYLSCTRNKSQEKCQCFVSFLLQATHWDLFRAVFSQGICATPYNH